MISLFGGSGFLGSAWRAGTKRHFVSMERERLAPSSHESLWLISTTHNYWPQTDATIDVRTNLLRLMETLQHVRSGETFNFVSSWFVYGKSQDWSVFPASESSPCDPRGFYSITKHCAERLVMSYCEARGIHWRIFRLSNIFGPGDKPSQKKNALQWMIGELAAGRPVSLYDAGSNTRDYLYVTDAVRALDLCLTHAPLGRITNIGYGESRTVGELVWLARGLLDSRAEVRASDPTAFHKQVQTKHFRMDVSRLRSLGFMPEVNPEEGVRRCCHLMSQITQRPAET